MYDTSPLTVFGGVRINSGASWDDSVRGVVWRRERRYDDWRALVKSQCDLIADICARKHFAEGVTFREAA